MSLLDLRRFKVLTFDCFGTLVDWETGILDALHPIVRRHDRSVSEDDLLALFARVEAPLQRGPYLRYRTVLQRATRAIGARLGFALSEQEADALARSLPTWPLFPDTVESLKALAQRYALGIISNVDDDLFAPVRSRLGAPISYLMTAERARSYKPSRNNFHRALADIGRPWSEVLHVAQSLYHDVAPARSLGLSTVWVDRRGGAPGGATPVADTTPDLRAPNLRWLVDLVPSDL